MPIQQALLTGDSGGGNQTTATSQQEWTSAGSYTFTVPADVYDIHIKQN